MSASRSGTPDAAGASSIAASLYSDLQGTLMVEPSFVVLYAVNPTPRGVDAFDFVTSGEPSLAARGD